MSPTLRSPALLDQLRSQWLLGDWEGLALTQDADALDHTDKSVAVMLKAIGHAQMGHAAEARELTLLASESGAHKRVLAQCLLSGVYNSLGRASALAGMEARAQSFFEKSLSTAVPGVASPAAVRARATLQYEQLQLSPLQSASSVAIHPQMSQLQPAKALHDFQPSIASSKLAHQCLNATDLHASVDEIRSTRLKDLSDIDCFGFYTALSDGIYKDRKDKMTALSYLQYARRNTQRWHIQTATAMASRLVKLGQANLAAEFLTDIALKGIGPIVLNAADRQAIEKANTSLHQIAGQKSEHGHDLLLAALNKRIVDYKKKVAPRQPVLIEIGTTREDVPGQGSTRKIALFCKQHDIGFVTVDMDPHNSLLAREMFATMGMTQFQAIAMKGEDYLRDLQGEIDFVFLDAYDFDHGQHSEIRQSRYQKFLGSRIDELQCHQMHLECALAVQAKLTKEGLVCVDDTWLDNGRWTAKGTLAMPYLLDNGFELLEARNRAALLGRQVKLTTTGSGPERPL